MKGYVVVGTLLAIIAIGIGYMPLMESGFFKQVPTKQADTESLFEQHDIELYGPGPAAAWKKTKPHLAEAERAADAAITKHCGRVSGFFAERKPRSRAFAEEALSYGSKWAFVKSKLPGTDADGHNKYLREQFEKLVFSSDELQQVLESAVSGCLAELQGIENTLLVKIRADLNDDALGGIKGDARFSSEEALRKEYAKAMQGVQATLKKDLPVWGAREAATWIGADLTAPIIQSITVSVLSRLGVSSGILGSGAASGVMTFGGGIIAGFIIDALLDRLLLALGYDPAADVEKQVIETLRESESLLLNGQGLSQHLSELSRERANLRYNAVRKLILEGGAR